MTIENWGIIVGVMLTLMLLIVAGGYPIIRLMLKAATTITAIETTIKAISERVTAIQKDMIDQRDTCKNCNLEVHGKLANHEGRIVTLEQKAS